MLEINIDPFLRLNSIEVRLAVITTIFAFMIAIGISIMEAKRRGKRLDFDVIGLILTFLIGTLVGGKLFFILDNWEYMLKYPAAVILSPAVLMYGVVIGALIAIFIYNRLFQEMTFWETGDMLAPGSMLGLAVYRIGCVINGCCYGVPTDSFWGVVYNHPASLAPLGIPLHPTQLYHVTLTLVGFIVLWLLRQKLKPQGALFLLWLTLLAVTDLPVRLFRMEDTALFNLSQAQLIGIIMLAIALPWLIIRIRSARTPR